MTDLLPDALPSDADPVDVQLRKARELIRFPKQAVSGPELRLIGARVLYDLGDISFETLSRYMKDAAGPPGRYRPPSGETDDLD